MTLADSKINISYKIKDICAPSQNIENRFFQLGFTLGTSLILKRKAPIFGDPLLFEVGHAQIALTKSEASYVKVEVIK